MRTFVTGATGFIGRRLVGALAGKDHELYCIDRRKKCMELQEQYGGKAFVGDITNKETLMESMVGCEQVVHLASNASFWELDKQKYKTINVEGTRNVMEAALELGVSKVVHISSALVYGNTPDRPFREESPVGPVKYSEYARTKYEGEKVAWDYYKKGLPLVVMYPGSVIGPGDFKGSGRYIYDVIHRKLPAMSLVDSVHTFVYVDDVVDAIVNALEKEGNQGEKYLVGKYQLSVGEFVELVGQISGVKTPGFRVPDTIVLWASELMTALSHLTRRPPPWGMSVDWVRSIYEGMVFDGTKAEKELGITYTLIKEAVEKVFEDYRA